MTGQNQEVRWGTLDWIELALGRERWRVLVNLAINLQVPWNEKQIDDKLRTTLLHGLDEFGTGGWVDELTDSSESHV